jgi:hypothetical protein
MNRWTPYVLIVAGYELGLAYREPDLWNAAMRVGLSAVLVMLAGQLQLAFEQGAEA